MSLSATFAVPGSLDTPTGGYAYDRRVIAELRKLGWSIDILNLGDGFPAPPEELRRQAVARLTGDAGKGPIVVDGLALGVLPDAAEALRGRRPLLALVHHPLALESGLIPAQADALRASERRALAAARGVIATSEATARQLVADYAVPPGSLTVAAPGTDRGRRAPGSRDGTVRMLSVGAIVPRKGYDVLLDALAGLADQDWHLVIVGDRERSPATTRALEIQVGALELGGRVTITGALPAPALTELYESSDLFVLASHFEGYGMALAEAVAHGLPVVATAAGAIPYTVPQGAGILVPSGDIAALAKAISFVVADDSARRGLADAAWKAAGSLPTWEEAGRTFDYALRSMK